MPTILYIYILSSIYFELPKNLSAKPPKIKLRDPVIYIKEKKKPNIPININKVYVPPEPRCSSAQLILPIKCFTGTLYIIKTILSTAPTRPITICMNSY